MRLTLRTMLAFMDNLLEPDDAREIGRKVEESEFATKLMHRLHDVVRRLRLSAPSANDRGILDPNTVAEYLDNTLPNDRVPDFEKICLESDMQLAEVASCHQILTLVLGEPAEVDPQSRERMYRIPETLAGVAEPRETPGDLASPPPVPGEIHVAKRGREKPSVPDYLRDPIPKRSRVLPVVGALALTAVVLLMILGALGQFESGSPLASLLGIGGPATEVAQGPAASSPDGTSTAQQEATTTGPIVVPAETPGQPPATAAGAKPEGAAPAAAAPSVAPLPPSTVLSGSGPAAPPVVSQPQVPTPAPSPTVSEPAVTIPGPVTASKTPEMPATLPVLGGDAKAMPPVAAPVAPGTTEAAAPPSAAAKAPGEPTTEPAPLPSQRLGLFVSDKQVLLQKSANENVWMRLPAQAGLNSGAPLLALPAYQSTLALNAGIAVKMYGGTELTLLPNEAQEPPGLDIAYGRLTIRAVGEAKGTLRIKIGQRVGTIRFRDADSSLAIEVGRSRTAGADPEAEPGPLRGALYAASGEFQWLETGDRPSIPVTAPAMLQIEDQPLLRTMAANDLPKWILNDDVSWLDRRAAPTLESSLQINRPVILGLRELVDHRQKEVGWLAVRCLGYLGEFDTMIAALNNSEARSLWDDYILHLATAIDRGAPVAAAIRKAMEKQYSQDAAALYRMLWGYSDKQIEAGKGEELVSYLDNETLAYRVLAFYNLEKLSGGVKFSYRPYDSAPKRQAAVARWKERLQTGLLPRASDSGEKKSSAPKSGSLL